LKRPGNGFFIKLTGTLLYKIYSLFSSIQRSNFIPIVRFSTSENLTVPVQNPSTINETAVTK